MQHVAACEDCRRQLAALQNVSAALRQQPPVPVPPFFASRLAHTLKAQRQHSLPADFVWLGKRLVPALALLLGPLLMWGPFESSETQVEASDYLSAAGVSSDMSWLAENAATLTQDEVLELVVLSSSLAQE